MSRPWPDEVRAMVDALMRGGACPRVIPHSIGIGWRVDVGVGEADYHEDNGWTFRGLRVGSAEVLAELLQRVAAVDPLLAFLVRLHAAVPTASVSATTDGMEVRVGSKSVRWKREQRGWSLADDLFCSDDRVIEHAKAMAAEQAPSLLERLREAVPGLEWEQKGDAVVGSAASQDLVSANPRRRLLCWPKNSVGPLAVDIPCPSDDECVRIVTEWYAKTHPAPAAPSLLDRLRTAIPSLTWEQVSEGEWIGRDAHDRDVARIVWRIDLGKRQEYIVACGTGHDDPNAYQASVTSADEAIDRVQRYVGETVARLEAPAAPQPSPRAQALLEALRAQGYEPTYEPSTRQFGETVACDGESAALSKGADLWWYLGGQAGTEYVAEQMGLRISRKRERTAAEPTTQATASTRSPREIAAHELVALFHREFPGATVGFKGDGSRVWVEQYSERVEWEQPLATGCWWRNGRTATNAQWIVATTRDVFDAAARWRGCSTVTVNGNVLDTDALAGALTQASKEALDQVKQAHATKGTTMTQTTAQQLAATMKVDASEAAWRTAGSQFVKLAREPLVGLLTRHLAPNDDAFRARLAAFLETELGTALLASMLSATLSALPQTTGEVPQKLARELRVRAMADVGDELASVLSGPLLQVMRVFLQDPGGTPAAPALDAPQGKSVEWATAEQKEGVR